MSTYELSSRVYHYVGTMLQRTVDDGCKGVIDYHRYVVSVGYLGYWLEVEHVRVWIAERLEIECLCVRLDGRLYLLQVAWVNDSIFYSLIGKSVSDEVVGTAIDVLCCHDVVA